MLLLQLMKHNDSEESCSHPEDSLSHVISGATGRNKYGPVDCFKQRYMLDGVSCVKLPQVTVFQAFKLRPPTSPSWFLFTT
ncbi:hypothetical protein EXN66_Car008100 [Channa argus]|uniref:Uncharacterized protein n=1 Tax=Channa argus TaxID=215402 RepID=A0A6G1PQK0_CHAAH|nr:hypothetical protein EXN66_Car008100 [Channa argus]